MDPLHHIQQLEYIKASLIFIINELQWKQPSSALYSSVLSFSPDSKVCRFHISTVFTPWNISRLRQEDIETMATALNKVFDNIERAEFDWTSAWFTVIFK